jgi:hypothetical protein
MFVLYVYFDLLDAPVECQWLGQTGTISKIASYMKVQPRQRQVLHRVLNQVSEMAKIGLVYDGERRNRTATIDLMVTPDLLEGQIIADAIEGGFSLRHTLELVNEHRRESKECTVGLSTVFSAFHRMNPVITPIAKRKQGTTDPNSPWAKARLEWVTQILVRFGILTGNQVTAPLVNVPDKFNATKVIHTSLNQIAFWDETHKKVRIGKVGANGTKFQVRFRRTLEGKVDSQCGR